MYDRPETTQKMHAGGGAGASCAAPPRQSGAVIRERFEQLEHRVAAIHDVITELYQRLDVALTPDAPAPNPTSQTASIGPPVSTLALRIAQLEYDAGAAVARLLELTQRVEV